MRPVIGPGFGQGLAERRGLTVVAFAGEDLAQELLQAAGVSAFLHHVRRDRLRGFEIGQVVLERQSLERGVGPSGAHFAGSTLGGVEEEGGRDRPTPEGVEGPTILGRAFAGLIFETTHEELFPDAVRLIRPHGRSAERRIEKAGGPQRGIADHPAGQTETRASGEQFVLGVLGEQGGGDRRVLAIGRAHDDEPKRPLQVPAVLDEIHGEPVEELRVERAFALQAEVFDSAHESLAEEHLPEMIHGHAGGEGILLGGQPARQSETRARLIRGPADERRWDVRGHLVAVLIPDAADEYEGVAGLLALGEDHDVQLAAGGLGFAELALGAFQREA